MGKSLSFNNNDIISPIERGIFMAIGDEIKLLRAELGLTQDEFAKKIAIHGRQLARYEAGTNKPSIAILKKIADFCEISLDRLVYGKDEYLSKRLRVSDQELLKMFRKLDKMKRPQRDQYKWILSSLMSKAAGAA
ncbi:MAG: helix-turn-helix domain-containing protein [Candidatus Omnitrophota bacterium]